MKARAAGVTAAAIVLALGLAWALHSQREFVERYDRFSQPGFDARVYMAMAEAPAFFTVEPWGYRLLSPWVMHLLSGAPDAGAFLSVTLAALFVAGLLLFAWLRRLGHGPPAAALGVALFAFSPPVSQAVRDPFLAEPLLAVLLMLFLLALEARAGSAVLALVAALGALGKDLFLFFLPTVFCVRAADVGWRRAAAESAVVSLPAVVVTWLLRAWWTPYLSSAEGGLPGTDVFWLALWRILEGAPHWVVPALLLGITPLALVGLFTVRARPFLRRYGWLLAITWALPFAASVYTADTASVPFFADDIPRLLLYALPTTLHLALLAVQPRFARVAATPAGALPRGARLVAACAALATAAVVAFPLVALDRYRRVDLRGPRDGPLLLALCRQSLAFARRLDEGRPVAYDVRARRFRPGKDLPHYLERMRWFLRDGWGERPHYADGPALMRARQATLLLPCLRPADWTLTLRLNARQPTALALVLNGHELERTVLRDDSRFKVQVPAAALFRGDNLLTLVTDEDEPQVELVDLRVQPHAAR